MKALILMACLGVTHQDKAAATAQAINSHAMRAKAAAQEINDHAAKAKIAAAEINGGKTPWILNKMVGATPPAAPQISVTLRQPEGHTHTCAAGHTWDHRENPGHHCTFPVVRNGKVVQCGQAQWYQDTSRRMVTVGRVISARVPTPDGRDCPNGNCPLARSPWN